MEGVQSIKQRFEIIGNDLKLNRALEKAVQVAPTDISVLVTGESGVGKEAIPKIIHSLSHRKHAKYIAVNCGAIPEGTIDSELFGHEKGAFTGATATRSGYFEVADGGTIFLDEVGELPLDNPSASFKGPGKWGIFKSRFLTGSKDRCSYRGGHQYEHDRGHKKGKIQGRPLL